MPGISGTVTSAFLTKLEALSDGVNARACAIRAADAGLRFNGVRSISARNVSADLSEKGGNASYPAVLVYCDKLSNSLKEKYRQFSGTAHLVAEVRNSEDRLDTIQRDLELYVDAVCALLDDSRGDWGDGAFYAGGYEVSYEPIARGGKNYLQRAKVGFEVEISK